MESRENEEFTRLLRGAVGEAEKLKYRPAQFKKMLDAYGGFDTVNRVLASGKPSDGFTRLWELGRLDLTCEAIIVETKWRGYFEADLVARAEKLLGDMRYPFTRFEGPTVVNRRPETVARQEQTIVESGGVSQEEVFAELSAESAARINAFFKDVLHAPVSNIRWSWGAVDERARRVFLRLWRMDIANLDGHQAIQVLGDWKTSSHGLKERIRHIDLVRGGYAAYAVVCDKDSQDAGVIRSFDRDTLLRLGQIIERDGAVYLQVVESTPVESISIACGSSDAIESDLLEVGQLDVSSTTRSALVDARLGQGRFRRELLRRWNGACSVTGCRVGAVLRASHCKPWRISDNRERLDSNNGLILTANLDALFDAGMISFDDHGGMLMADVLLAQERSLLGLPASLLRLPSQKLQHYLSIHRALVFLK